MVDTPSVDGEIKKHVIRSSPACTGFLDIQMQDREIAFAVYDLRLPCSRTTGGVGDHIQLKFDFDLTYDIATDLVTANGNYLDGLTGASNADFDAANMNPLGFYQDLSVGVKYGTCAGDNTISEKCAGTDDFAIETGQKRFHSGSLQLSSGWKDCAASVEDRDSEESYIVTTNIAMTYNRVLKYGAADGPTYSNENFCADKRFVTTIRRDATASVTVSTLRAPALERALTIDKISWVSCSGGTGHELVIELSANQRAAGTSDAWSGKADSTNILSTVVKPTSATAVDSDGLNLDLGNGDFHTFQVKSACIAITQAQCDAISAPQTNADDSGSDFAKLSHTETDLVLRGPYTGSDVDSDAKIITKFLECPLDQEENDATGSLRAAAIFDCDAPVVSGASDTIEERTDDCKTGFTTDNGEATVKLYITPDGHTGKVTNAQEAAATAAGWKIRHSVISIERYEKNFDGSEGAIISSDVLCTCGAPGDKLKDGTSQCTEGVPPALPGVSELSRFDANTFACGTAEGSGYIYDKVRFDFEPLIAATADTFKIHFDILAENTGAEARRRLRTSYTVSRKHLEAAQSAQADAGFGVILPSTNTSTTAAPTTTAAPAEDALEWWAILLIVVGSVLVLGLGIWGIDSATGFLSGSPSSGQFGSGGAAAVGIRQSRFSNLRY